MSDLLSVAEAIKSKTNATTNHPQQNAAPAVVKNAEKIGKARASDDDESRAKAIMDLLTSSSFSSAKSAEKNSKARRASGSHSGDESDASSMSSIQRKRRKKRKSKKINKTALEYKD
jgi:hypothetical protein